jgi:energy-coupling factor transporter transmembrane protein EcfT
MIQLSYLDYIAVEKKSFLHRLSPKLKIIGMVFVLLGLITLRNLPGLFLLYGILLVLFFLSRIPIRLFSLTLYPLIFAILFIFVSGFQIHFIMLIFAKVLCGSTGVILLLATTPYPSIFSVLGKVLPSPFVTALFFDLPIHLYPPQYSRGDTAGPLPSWRIPVETSVEKPDQYFQCLRPPDH